MNEHDRKGKYRMRKLYQARITNGECPSCGRKRTDNQTYRCAACMHQQRKNRKRLKNEGRVIIRVRQIKNHLLFNRMTELGIGTTRLSKIVGVSSRNVIKWITKGALPNSRDVREKVNTVLNAEIFS